MGKEVREISRFFFIISPYLPLAAGGGFMQFWPGNKIGTWGLLYKKIRF